MDTTWFLFVMLGDHGASTELVRNGKIVPVLNYEAPHHEDLWGIGVTAPRDFSTRWRCVVSCTPRSLYPGIDPLVPTV